MREIYVSRTGDPFHAGDKAHTRETPHKGGGLTGMQIDYFLNKCLEYSEVS